MSAATDRPQRQICHWQGAITPPTAAARPSHVPMPTAAAFGAAASWHPANCQFAVVSYSVRWGSIIPGGEVCAAAGTLCGGEDT